MLKKASFSTVGPSAFNTPSAGILGTKKKDNKKSVAKTIRIEIKLTRPTRETYCEYSYSELANAASNTSGVLNAGDSVDPLDPFASEYDDENLKRIANKFNEKYGPKRTKFNRLEDLIDKGAGYDDSDSFINNDEAYDELVPYSLTTTHGGFYINTGTLDFKPIDELEELDEDSDEDDDEENDEGGDSDACEVKPPKIKISKRNRSPETSGPIKKRKVLMSKKNFVRPKASQPSSTSKAQSNCENSGAIKPSDQAQSTVQAQKQISSDDSSSSSKESSSDDQIRPVGLQRKKSLIEFTTSPVNKDVEDKKGQKVSEQKKREDDGGDSGRTSASSPECGDTANTSDRIPKLPDNLPTKLQELLKLLKETRLSAAAGKKSFFTDHVNKILLEVEKHCIDLPKGYRNQIYANLSCFLPCNKDTLLRRAKKLYKEAEERRKSNANKPRFVITNTSNTNTVHVNNATKNSVAANTPTSSVSITTAADTTPSLINHNAHGQSAVHNTSKAAITSSGNHSLPLSHTTTVSHSKASLLSTPPATTVASSATNPLPPLSKQQAAQSSSLIANNNTNNSSNNNNGNSDNGTNDSKNNPSGAAVSESNGNNSGQLKQTITIHPPPNRSIINKQRLHSTPSRALNTSAPSVNTPTSVGNHLQHGSASPASTSKCPSLANTSPPSHVSISTAQPIPSPHRPSTKTSPASSSSPSPRNLPNSTFKPQLQQHSLIQHPISLSDPQSTPHPVQKSGSLKHQTRYHHQAQFHQKPVNSKAPTAHSKISLIGNQLRAESLSSKASSNESKPLTLNTAGGNGSGNNEFPAQKSMLSKTANKSLNLSKHQTKSTSSKGSGSLNIRTLQNSSELNLNSQNSGVNIASNAAGNTPSVNISPASNHIFLQASGGGLPATHTTIKQATNTPATFSSQSTPFSGQEWVFQLIKQQHAQAQAQVHVQAQTQAATPAPTQAHQHSQDVNQYRSIFRTHNSLGHPAFCDCRECAPVPLMRP